MAEEAKRSLMPLLDAAQELAVRPPEEMAPAELLGATSIKGLLQVYRILDQPLDLADLKQQRLIGDMALGVNKLFVRVAEGEFRARRDDALGRLLELIQAARGAETK